MSGVEDVQAVVAANAAVRVADATELEAVGAVLRAANAEFAGIFPPAFYRAYMTNVLDLHSRLRDSQLLVAELDGRIAGTITFYPDASKEGWDWPARWSGIRAVAVSPEARGLGIGRQLALACIDRARLHGAEAVCLHTSPLMAAAVAMYERLGFRRCPDYDLDLEKLIPFDATGPRNIATAYWRVLS